jgi:hypothetical protein
MDQLAEFMEFHTEARYPDAKMEFYQKCTKDFAQMKFREIKKVYKWFFGVEMCYTKPPLAVALRT